MISMKNICVGASLACALMPGAIKVSAQTASADPDARFLEMPAYRGDNLGLTVNGARATFRMWSPEAEAVRLRLYKNGRGGEPLRTFDMDRSEEGTWTYTVTPVPYGRYYTFQIKHNGR